MTISALGKLAPGDFISVFGLQGAESESDSAKPRQQGVEVHQEAAKAQQPALTGRELHGREPEQPRAAAGTSMSAPASAASKPSTDDAAGPSKEAQQEELDLAAHAPPAETKDKQEANKSAPAQERSSIAAPSKEREMPSAGKTGLGATAAAKEEHSEARAGQAPEEEVSKPEGRDAPQKQPSLPDIMPVNVAAISQASLSTFTAELDAVDTAVRAAAEATAKPEAASGSSKEQPETGKQEAAKPQPVEQADIKPAEVDHQGAATEAPPGGSIKESKAESEPAKEEASGKAATIRQLQAEIDAQDNLVNTAHIHSESTPQEESKAAPPEEASLVQKDIDVKESSTTAALASTGKEDLPSKEGKLSPEAAPEGKQDQKGNDNKVSEQQRATSAAVGDSALREPSLVPETNPKGLSAEQEELDLSNIEGEAVAQAVESAEQPPHGKVTDGKHAAAGKDGSASKGDEEKQTSATKGIPASKSGQEKEKASASREAPASKEAPASMGVKEEKETFASKGVEEKPGLASKESKEGEASASRGDRDQEAPASKGDQVKAALASNRNGERAASASDSDAGKAAPGSHNGEEKAAPASLGDEERAANASEGGDDKAAPSSKGGNEKAAPAIHESGKKDVSVSKDDKVKETSSSEASATTAYGQNSSQQQSRGNAHIKEPKPGTDASKDVQSTGPQPAREGSRDAQNASNEHSPASITRSDTAQKTEGTAGRDAGPALKGDTAAASHTQQKVEEAAAGSSIPQADNTKDKPPAPVYDPLGFQDEPTADAIDQALQVGTIL